jgi:hypothetical protein
LHGRERRFDCFRERSTVFQVWRNGVDRITIECSPDRFSDLRLLALEDRGLLRDG